MSASIAIQILPKLEADAEVFHEQMRVVNHRIKDLEDHHGSSGASQ